MTLDLTDEEAELFTQFRKYQSKIQVLIDFGVLDIHGGNAILHYDDAGEIRKVETSCIKYIQLHH